jgi:DNA-binding CsgD family transcriptional regulator
MPKSQRIKHADVREMLRLLGECRELGDDPIVWRHRLMGGIARLVDADFAAGGEMQGCATGAVRSSGAAVWGLDHGFDLRGLQIIWEWNAVDPYYSQLWKRAHERLQQGPRPEFTLARQQLLSPREWDRSPDYQIAMRTLGADAVVHSFRQLPHGGDQHDGVCWFRAAGRPTFDEREVALMELIHEEATRLIGGPLARFDEPRPSQLPPRVRQVLHCLLEGDSDKQAAARLALSPHTVNQYTKQIYRHFGVNGRMELLSRWLRRGWSAVALWDAVDPSPPVLVP